MFERRDSNTGWLLVVGAVVAVVAFAGLLYVRGGSAPRLRLGSGGDTALATPLASPSRAPSASGAAGRATPSAGSSRAPTGSGAVAGATSPPRGSAAAGASAGSTTAPSKTPRPSATPKSTPRATSKPTAPAAAGYTLPSANQAATIALEHGQGDCPNFPVGGVVVESVFTQPGAGRLTATSPSGQHLTGRVRTDGSFSLAAENPTERWVGSLSDSGGSGSYFVVSNGCTEGYETTIAFH